MQQKFDIHTSIYPLNIITQACNDFSDIADIQYSEKQVLISWENEQEIEETFGELMNYMIWLINQ